VERLIGTPVKVVKFMDFGAIPWNRMTNVVRVRELRTNKEFNVYEHQLKYDISVIDLPESSFEDKELNSIVVMAYLNPKKFN